MLQSLWKPKEGFSRRFEIQKRVSVEEQTAKETDTVTAGTSTTQVQLSDPTNNNLKPRSSFCLCWGGIGSPISVTNCRVIESIVQLIMRQSRGDGRQVRGQRKTEAAVRGRQGQSVPSYLGLTTGSQQVPLKPPGQGTGCGWISFFHWDLNMSTVPHVILSIRSCFLHTGHCVVLLTLACVCLSAFVVIFSFHQTPQPHITLHSLCSTLIGGSWGKLPPLQA
jgi:hypothetical protein